MLGFKVFNQKGIRPCFHLVEEKKCFGWEYAKEVWELFHSLPALILIHTFVGENCCGKVYLMQRGYGMFKQTKKMFSFYRYWSKQCTGEFCFIKEYPVRDQWKIAEGYFFRIWWKHSYLKYQFQVKSWWTASWWHISNIYCRQYEGIYTNQVNEALSRCFLIVFNESWGKWRGGEYQKVSNCRSCMSSAGSFACAWMKHFQNQKLFLT